MLIEDNTFEDITAEGADLKEGTDSGTLRRNTFRRVGGSGKNSADSAVDAKGNGWLIEANTVHEAMAPWDDDGRRGRASSPTASSPTRCTTGTGSATPSGATSWSVPIPGFGVGLYPAAGNVVTCDNQAIEAALGLVGDRSQSSSCT